MHGGLILALMIALFLGTPCVIPSTADASRTMEIWTGPIQLKTPQEEHAWRLHNDYKASKQRLDGYLSGLQQRGQDMKAIGFGFGAPFAVDPKDVADIARLKEAANKERERIEKLNQAWDKNFVIQYGPLSDANEETEVQYFDPDKPAQLQKAKMDKIEARIRGNRLLDKEPEPKKPDKPATPGATPQAPQTAPPEPKPPEKQPPRYFFGLPEKEKEALFGCICKCSLGAAVGVYTAYDTKPSDSSPSCSDLGNGPCIASGWGCWRSHMVSSGDCFEFCVKDANVIPGGVVEHIRKDREATGDRLKNEADDLVNFYKQLPEGQTLNGRTKEKVDRGDIDKAVQKIDQAARAKGAAQNYVDIWKRDVAQRLPERAVHVVDDMDFPTAYKLLNKAKELDPKNTSVDGTMKQIQKWEQDWSRMQVLVQQGDGFLKNKQVGEARKILDGELAQRNKSFTISQYHGMKQKNKLVYDYQARVNAAVMECSRLPGLDGGKRQLTNYRDWRTHPNYGGIKDKEAIKLADDLLKLETLCDYDRKEIEDIKKMAEARDKQETARALRLEGEKFQRENKLPEAIGKFRASLATWPDKALEEHVKALEARDKQNRDTAQRLKAEGNALEQQGRYQEAIGKLQQSLQYAPDESVFAHVKSLESKIRETRDRANTLWNESQTLYSQGRRSEALTKAQESIKLLPDPVRNNWVKQAESTRAYAQGMRANGEKAQQQGNIPEALKYYKWAYDAWPDDGLKQHMALLESKQKEMQDQTQRRAYAQQLQNEGYRFEQANRLQEAIGKYRQSISYWPNQDLENRVRTLEARMAAGQQTAAQVASQQTPKADPKKPVDIGASTQRPVDIGASKPSTTAGTMASVDPAHSLDGNYSGSIGGAATGIITMKVNGGSASGAINGTYNNDTFRGTWSGTANQSTGEVNGNLTGDIGGYAFQGGLTGRISGTSVSGSWHARNQYGNPTGAWQASRGVAPPGDPVRTPAPVVSSGPTINIIGRWKTVTNDSGKQIDVGSTTFNRDGSYTMDINTGEAAAMAKCVARGTYSLAGQNLTMRPQSGECRFNDGKVQPMPFEKQDSVAGRISGNDRTFTLTPGGNVYATYTRE
jgi:tetratricopeptide (TPR) repeat protein